MPWLSPDLCVRLWLDDLEEAYQKLRQVMNEYLKIKQQEEPEKNNRTSPSNTSSGAYLFTEPLMHVFSFTLHYGNS